MIKFPEWIEPMAATLTAERFTGPDWVFERKLDGIRMLAFKQGNDVRLLSRNRLAQNDLPIRRRGDRRTCPCTTSFSTAKLTGGGGSRQGAYHVFDILWLDGRDRHRLAARGTPDAVGGPAAAGAAAARRRARR